MSQVTLKKDAAKILRTVPMEEGFHFNMPNGTSTNVTATSLQDFAEKLKDVNADSIMYHYPRGDFQAWIKDTLGDRKLSNRLCFIETGIPVETLRKQVGKIVQKRIGELKHQR
jgi:hypothetical protein